MITLQYFHSFQNSFVKDSGIDFESDSFKVALLSGSYSPDLSSHVYFDDVNAYEIQAVNYTSGGKVLENQTVSHISSTNTVVFDADNVVWSLVDFSTSYLVLYKDTGDISTSPLILLGMFDTEQSPTSSFTIQWSDSGILKVAYE